MPGVSSRASSSSLSDDDSSDDPLSMPNAFSRDARRFCSRAAKVAAKASFTFSPLDASSSLLDPSSSIIFFFAITHLAAHAPTKSDCTASGADFVARAQGLPNLWKGSRGRAS